MALSGQRRAHKKRNRRPAQCQRWSRTRKTIEAANQLRYSWTPSYYESWFRICMCDKHIPFYETLQYTIPLVMSVSGYGRFHSDLKLDELSDSAPGFSRSRPIYPQPETTCNESKSSAKCSHRLWCPLQLWEIRTANGSGVSGERIRCSLVRPICSHTYGKTF